MSEARFPRLLLVTGMSGAGKSTVLDTLEDMGWDMVDNLPVDLLQEFVNPHGQCRVVPAAVAMDPRTPRLRPAPPSRPPANESAVSRPSCSTSIAPAPS